MATNLEKSTSSKFADGTAIAAITIVLDMLSAQLVDIAEDVETSVNGVCSGFQGMATRAKDALTTASDSLDLTNDGGGLQAFVHRVRLSLDGLMRRIESTHEFSTQLSSDIDDLDERLELLLHFSDQLEAIADEAKEASKKHGRLNEREHPNEVIIAGLREQVSVLAFAIDGSGSALRGVVKGMRTAIATTAGRARSKANEDQTATIKNETTVRTILAQLTASYNKMTESLSKSASMSRQLNMDIGQAVMSMQFQDRVNQRIEHLRETIDDLASELKQFTGEAEQDKVESITQFWLDRMNERSTMQAERIQLPEEQSASDDSSIELF